MTNKLLDASLAAGSQIIIGTCDKIVVENGVTVGVNIENEGFFPAENVVVCLGPWSGVFCEDNFGISMPIEGVKSTSLIYHNLEKVQSDPYALFCAEDRNDCHLEFYPRPNGDLYICGCGKSDYVSGDRLRRGGDCSSADKIDPDMTRVAAARSSFSSLSSLGDRTPDVVQVIPVSIHNRLTKHASI